MTARPNRVVRVGPGATSDQLVSAVDGAKALRMDSLSGIVLRPHSCGVEDSNSALSRKGPCANPGGLDPRAAADMLDQLDQCRGWIAIVLFLYREKSASPYQLRRSLRPGQEEIEHVLRMLVRLGLARFDKSSRFPFATTYRLTDRGQRLAEIPPRSWMPIVVQ